MGSRTVSRCIFPATPLNSAVNRVLAKVTPAISRGSFDIPRIQLRILRDIVRLVETRHTDLGFATASLLLHLPVLNSLRHGGRLFNKSASWCLVSTNSIWILESKLYSVRQPIQGNSGGFSTGVSLLDFVLLLPSLDDVSRNRVSLYTLFGLGNWLEEEWNT